MALRRDRYASSARWTLSKLDRLSESSDYLIGFLHTHGIISINRVCKKCGKDKMTLNERAHRLSGMQQKNIAEECEISPDCAVHWNKFCREVVYWINQTRSSPIGDEHDVVEIYESKFGKVKYHRGHRVEGSWVFGGISRRNCEVFLQQVEKRDRATLLPLIERCIKPTTIIICDGWRAYDVLDQHDYDLFRVNHSETFKTNAEHVPDTFPTHVRNVYLPLLHSCTSAKRKVHSVHTNSIEATCGAIKRMVFRSPGNHFRTYLPGALAKYLFIKQCRLKNIDPFIAMLMACRDAHASGDNLDYFVLENETDSENNEEEENFKEPLLDQVLGKFFQPVLEQVQQIPGLPSGISVGSRVLVPWPIKSTKKIEAFAEKIPDTVITIVFSNGSTYMYRRYL